MGFELFADNAFLMVAVTRVKPVAFSVDRFGSGLSLYDVWQTWTTEF